MYFFGKYWLIMFDILHNWSNKRFINVTDGTLLGKLQSKNVKIKLTNAHLMHKKEYYDM